MLNNAGMVALWLCFFILIHAGTQQHLSNPVDLAIPIPYTCK